MDNYAGNLIDNSESSWSGTALAESLNGPHRYLTCAVPGYDWIYYRFVMWAAKELYTIRLIDGAVG